MAVRGCAGGKQGGRAGQGGADEAGLRAQRVRRKGVKRWEVGDRDGARLMTTVRDLAGGGGAGAREQGC